jgi:hypothetical protein
MTWLLVLDVLKKILGNRYVQLALVAIALFGGGYATGRFAQPAKVITTEKVVTQIQDHIVYQDRVVTKIVYVKEKKQQQHTETVTEKKPDGTVVTKTETDIKTDTNTNVNTDKDQTKTGADTKTTVTTDEKKTVTIRQPLDWRVAGGVGVSIPVFLGAKQLGIPGLNAAVIQLEIDRRIIGPFFLGLFANSQGTLGLNLSGVF